MLYYICETGTAIESLPSMQAFLSSRPKCFRSLEHAIEWWYVCLSVTVCVCVCVCVRAGTKSMLSSVHAPLNISLMCQL